MQGAGCKVYGERCGIGVRGLGPEFRVRFECLVFRIWYVVFSVWCLVFGVQV